MKGISQGVLIIMAHLIITLAMISAYILFAYLDKTTTTIENMLLIAIGFWFSAVNKQNIKDEIKKDDERG